MNRIGARRGRRSKSGVRRGPWLTLSLAVAFTIAGCSVGVDASPSTPLTTPSFSSEATVGASPSASLRSIPAALGDVWESRLVESGAQVSAIAAFGSAWVAVGSGCVVDSPGCGQRVNVIWRSLDAGTWTRSAEFPGSDGTSFIRIASSGTALYVVGETYGVDAAGTYTSALVLRSLDGVAWQSVGSPGTFELGRCFEGCPDIGSIAAGPAGILISGGAHMWSSVDGASWERLEGQTVAMDRGQIASWAGGFMKIGTVDGRAATWRSTDGRQWTGPTELPRPRDLAAGEEISPARVVAGSQRVVVIGSRCRGETDTSCTLVTWTSGDGVTWSVGSIDGEAFPAFIAESGGTFLVLAAIQGQWTSWTSTDGTAWSRRSSVGLPGNPQVKGAGIEVADLAGSPRGVILMPGFDAADRGLWFSEVD